METKGSKEKLPSCLFKSPGPVHKLRPLVGYNDHCPSRYRSPAYSMRHRGTHFYDSIGPGPKYDISKLTNFGVDYSPAFTIGNREAFQIRDKGPGPGAHYPELCPPMNHSLRPPAYSIKGRELTKYSKDGPGPNVYSLPSCIGPNIPDKRAQGAFSMGIFTETKLKEISPGPAAYRNINVNIIRRSAPAFSVKRRTPLAEISLGPGPQYLPNYEGEPIYRRAPMYSFGIRHSICAGLPITTLDED